MWDETDFIVLGLLLASGGVLLVLVWRKAPCRYRAAGMLIVVAGLIFVWAELAVGVFTNIGS